MSSNGGLFATNCAIKLMIGLGHAIYGFFRVYMPPPLAIFFGKKICERGWHIRGKKSYIAWPKPIIICATSRKYFACRCYSSNPILLASIKLTAVGLDLLYLRGRTSSHVRTTRQSTRSSSTEQCGQIAVYPCRQQCPLPYDRSHAGLKQTPSRSYCLHSQLCMRPRHET